LSTPEPEQPADVLAKDSQAGTACAQDRQEPARPLTDADLLVLEPLIGEMDAGLSADTIL